MRVFSNWMCFLEGEVALPGGKVEEGDAGYVDVKFSNLEEK